MNGINFAFHCLERPEPSGKRVAIIGSGPAGLSAAGYLACRGHEVHVYDKLPEPGGLMLFAIPEFRIPVERVRLGYRDLMERMGVKFHTGVKVISGERKDEGDEFVEKTVDFEELVRDFDAVLIATGTWKSWLANIPGIELDGVFKALEYLFKIKSAKLGHMDWSKVPEIKGKRVMVVGAGHTACDAALESLLLGAEEVYMSYRRTIREAPAGSYEINLLREKGVEWLELTMPKRIIGEKGRVKGVELVRTKLSEPDETGRRKPVPIEGSEFTVEVDYVVCAMGQIPTPPFGENVGIATDRKGRIVVDSQHMTSREGVFAAGDVVLGPSLVGRATRDGLYAARDIHLWLTGVRA
ncbi:FAD-dependent oxidoreductase [Thermococcus sp.]|uniref:FAD-dependent oxidoreductase n=5 Tax=Thermococcus sp. TaxID=35749 RepID=UPI0025F65803|nr:FAD-dependent oxidoreductase [Thermococcus sp.]